MEHVWLTLLRVEIGTKQEALISLNPLTVPLQLSLSVYSLMFNFSHFDHMSVSQPKLIIPRCLFSGVVMQHV